MRCVNLRALKIQLFWDNLEPSEADKDKCDATFDICDAYLEQFQELREFSVDIKSMAIDTPATVTLKRPAS
ncbi:uncharacterized protein N7483_003789 [Penicillium malachiteum]|uniref:uncharacterized protein n=1 Tax=Penicillium malachiteum TaxID=1324776 RepID=UPI002547DE9B|nr:uncharacterized protein N7483_003789 [Penicillium malachiteum]KAJ5729281.1 hypothetical protein N7483_003789 [Penicillium malachiteum]